jgi:glycosyltransferase involved in cell wall biosynthesis
VVGALRPRQHEGVNGMGAHVSIIIPAFNRREMLGDAIRSCAASAPGLHLEVIVVDDASHEDIRGTVEGLPVLYERLPVNSGSSVARNRGIELAQGAYVKFLDSDDLLVEGALAREYRAAVDHDADIVVSGWIESRIAADGAEARLQESAPPRFSSIADDLLAGRAVPTSSALYAARIAKRVAWDRALSKLNDWDYFVRAAWAARSIHTEKGAAYVWRQHAGERITSSSSFMKNSLEFYAILAKLEQALAQSGELTPARKERLAQYLYKELRGLYRFRRPERHAVLARIRTLDPVFAPRDEERSLAMRALLRFLPAAPVLEAYGLAKRSLDRIQGGHA